MKDLIVFVADGHQKAVMEALLPRIPKSSNTAEFGFEVKVNPGKDSGTYIYSHELLRPYINQYRFALVVFDFEGTGVEHLPLDQVKKNVQELLEKNGWKGRSAVIVIQPELENWMWMDNRNVEQAIGWEEQVSLYDWAKKEGLLAEDATKPDRPKEAFLDALRLSRTPLSASIYGKIAAKVSYGKCQDAAFQDLIQQLKAWFPLQK
ncbi:MAG: hypothetical protein JNJ90_11175 [Saprospiraceae bacterium]|jgi:hypothetical protein|nr:hypothetical protein [Saprospiraceae bacterium]